MERNTEIRTDTEKKKDTDKFKNWYKLFIYGVHLKDRVNIDK